MQIVAVQTQRIVFAQRIIRSVKREAILVAKELFIFLFNPSGLFVVFICSTQTFKHNLALSPGIERMTDQGASSDDQHLEDRGRRRTRDHVPLSTQTGSAEAPSNNVPNSGPSAAQSAPKSAVELYSGMAEDLT